MFANFKVPSLTKRKVSLFDFSNSVNGLIDGHIAKNTLAKRCFNFDYSNGALKDGVGVEHFQIDTGNGPIKLIPPSFSIKPKKVYYYKRYDDINEREDDRLIILYNDKSVYEWKIFSSTGTLIKINDLSFESAPFSACYRLNGEDVILFSTNGVLYVYNGERVTSFDAPLITSMCIHNERLFATTGGSQTELWFSKTFDPTNWNVSLDEAGFIDFRTPHGRLLKVVSLNGYLYVFSNYGIFRVSAYADQTETYADSIYVNSGRIIGSSVTECGKYVIYLAQDGFYRFDGVSSVKIMSAIDQYLDGVDNENAVSAYYNGKLYVSLKAKFDGRTERVLLVYDLVTNEFYFAKDLKIYDLVKINGNEFSKLLLLDEGSVYICQLNYNARYFLLGLDKEWVSYPNDYGIEGEKTFSSINLYTKTPISVTISSEYGTKNVNFDGKLTRQSKKVGLKGKTFTVKFATDSENTEISKVVIILEYL